MVSSLSISPSFALSFSPPPSLSLHAFVLHFEVLFVLARSPSVRWRCNGFYESRRWCHLLSCADGTSSSILQHEKSASSPELVLHWKMAVQCQSHTIARTSHNRLYHTLVSLAIGSPAYERIKTDYGFCFDVWRFNFFFSLCFHWEHFRVSAFVCRAAHSRRWQRLSKMCIRFIRALRRCALCPSIHRAKRKRLIWIYCFSVNCFERHDTWCLGVSACDAGEYRRVCCLHVERALFEFWIFFFFWFFRVDTRNAWARIIRRQWCEPLAWFLTRRNDGQPKWKK